MIMCKYCEGQDKEDIFNTKLNFGLLGNYEFSGTLIEHNKVHEAGIEVGLFDNSGDVKFEYIKVNYCPICGRNLNK
jgi:hypothetical protein